MKQHNYPFNILIFSIIPFFCILLYGQEAQTKLNVPQKLTALLERKVALDRAHSGLKQFTIQVHYGNFDSTNEKLERFKEWFPELDSKLVFETPNYKIRTGNFATEREALEMLDRIKHKFPSAFVLKP